MSVEAFVLLALLGVLVGGLGTVIGSGGGFALTPVLVLLYPHDAAQSLTAISLVAVFFNALSGSVAYGRQKRIDYRSGLIFGAATLPGAVGGVLAVQAVPHRVFQFALVLLLFVMSVWILLPATATTRGLDHIGSRRTIRDAAGDTHRYAVPVRRGVVYSVGVGFISSFLGIGGGVIHVPLLIQVLGFPVHIATATSHFVLAIMAGTATVTHFGVGSFAHGYGLHRALALSLGVVVGAQIGARMSTGMGGVAIRRLLAVSLFALAVRLLIAAS